MGWVTHGPNGGKSSITTGEDEAGGDAARGCLRMNDDAKAAGGGPIEHKGIGDWPCRPRISRRRVWLVIHAMSRPSALVGGGGGGGGGGGVGWVGGKEHDGKAHPRRGAPGDDIRGKSRGNTRSWRITNSGTPNGHFINHFVIMKVVAHVVDSHIIGFEPS